MKNLLQKSKLLVSGLLISLMLSVNILPLWSATELATWAETAAVNSALDGDYLLVVDLGSGDTGYDTYASSSANGGAGWSPLGTFTGTFDGGLHAINDLYISMADTDYVGLFSNVSGGVNNLMVLNATVTGKASTAILFGKLSSTASNLKVSGTVIGTSSVGGVVGDGTGCHISKSVSLANVSGTIYAGSFAGVSGTYTHCYATGTTTRINAGPTYFGNFIGANPTHTNCYATGAVYFSPATTSRGFTGLQGLPTGMSSFWDTQTSGQTTGLSAKGRTTAQLMDKDNYNAQIFSGVVNVAAGSYTVNWVSGDKFETGWAGTDIVIDGVSYTINTILSTTAMATTCQEETTGVAYTKQHGDAWDMVLVANHDGQEATAIWYIDDGNDYPHLWFEYEGGGEPETKNTTNWFMLMN